jgi:DNA-binding NarL/FixJ family response regulator
VHICETLAPSSLELRKEVFIVRAQTKAVDAADEKRPIQPRVLLADDHGPIIERVTALLRSGFNVVGSVDNGRDLVSEAARLQPDVIVLDISMPGLTGIEAAQELREARSTAKLIFLTVHERVEFVRACLAEGALGYVVKSRLAVDLLPAIREALAGRRFISPPVSR